MSKITASTDIDRLEDPKQQIKYIAIALDQIVTTLNGKIELGVNVLTNSQTVSFSTANTDTTFDHTLGRVPSGYIVSGLSAALIVYDGVQSWTASRITLRASAAGTARLILF